MGELILLENIKIDDSSNNDELKFLSTKELFKVNNTSLQS